MPIAKLSDFELGFDRKGTGTPVLFVHGFPLDRRMWKSQIDEVSEFCEAITIDLRGFGECKSNVENDQVISMAEYADDCAEFLNHLQIEKPIVFCGLSMGGYIGFEFLRRHSQHLAGLILCDTQASADDETTLRGREVMARHVLKGGNEILVESMPTKLLAESSNADSDLQTFLQNTIRNTSCNSIAAALRGMAVREDSNALLNSIDIPTLVACGRFDKITTLSRMQTMANQIANSTFLEIPDSGHLAPFENPASFNAGLRDWMLRFFPDS